MRYLLILTLLLFHAGAQMLSRTQVIMGTFVTISASEKDSELMQEGFGILKDVEASLSSYDKNSTIYKLNKNLHVKLDAYSFEALALCKKYYQNTDGYFDITVGKITKDLYRFGEDERVAKTEELKEAKVGFFALDFNRTEASLQEGAKVDLGGMGKGYGVDKAAEHFRNSGVSDAVIAASGDIRCLSTCSVKVQNPFAEDGYMLSFDTAKADFGISTSGNYNRYVESAKNNHLIDPKTKEPQQRFVSITLVGDMSNADLDAYTTAASVMPLEKAYSFLDGLGVGYIVLQSSGELRISQNIGKYVKNLVKSDAFK